VKPLWEEEACKNGGRWVIKLPKTHTAKYWEEMLLGMIGEQFDTVPSGEILGLVLSLKFNNDLISIWHRTSSPGAIENIKQCIYKVLGNTAFKGSSAFNKKSAVGADLASMVDAGAIQINHEVFSDLMKQESTRVHTTPAEPKPFFERGAYRGGRGQRGGYRGGADHEEKRGDDEDGF